MKHEVNAVEGNKRLQRMVIQLLHYYRTIKTMPIRTNETDVRKAVVNSFIQRLAHKPTQFLL